MNLNNDVLLCKYQDVRTYNRLLEALVKKRLYAATYDQLNDPMEGYFIVTSGMISPRSLNRLTEEQKRIRICSLTQKEDDLLMWSHYSDGARGIMMQVELIEDGLDIHHVSYSQAIYHSEELENLSFSDVLTHKQEAWAYEKEVRVLSESKYVNVAIRKIVTGERMTDQDYGLLKELVTRISSDTEVLRVKEYRKLIK
jgi:hypothetical protein